MLVLQRLQTLFQCRTCQELLRDGRDDGATIVELTPQGILANMIVEWRSEIRSISDRVKVM